MKKLFQVFLAIVLCFSAMNAQDNVGIGTTTPNASAILDLTSTSKGFLPPRMTTTERNNIPTPAIGLIIFNTTDTQYQYFNGSSWSVVSGLSSVGLDLPTSVFDVANSPLTSSGTITVSFDNQNQNLIFASPDGSTGAPSFRAIVASDIPNLDASKIISGSLPVDRGGSGVGTLTGMLKGNGTSNFTAIVNTAGNVTYWSDANTISGSNTFTYDATAALMAVDGSIRLVPKNSAPNSGSELKGQMYFDNNTSSYKYWNGSAWTDFGGSGSLPSGTNNQTIRNNSGVWESTSILRVTSARVGIGDATVTPSALIHSDGGTAFAHYHKFTAGTTTGTNAGDGFDVGIDDQGFGVLNQRGNRPIILSTNGLERARINGNNGGLTVNIGNLTYSDVSAINLNNTNAAARSIALNITNSLTGSATSDGLRLGIDGAGTGELSQLENFPLVLKTNSLERMRIWEDGQIGIGLATNFNDTLKLWVNGDVMIDGDLVVTGNIDPKSIQLVPQNTPPVSSSTKGFMYYDNNSNSIKITDGTGWSDLGSSVASNLEVKNTDNNAKELRLYEPSSSGSEYSAFKAQTQGSNITYTLPASVGAANSFLKNDGAGSLAWTPVPDSKILNVISVTGTYTVGSTDDVLICSGNAFTITLPSAVGNSGRVIHFTRVNTASAQYTISASGGQKINGTNPVTINQNSGDYALTIVSDGSNWFFLANYPNF